jgi:hypothetical protein
VSRQSRTCTSASPGSHPSCRNAQAIAHDAFRALVNLSDSPMIHPHLAEPSFLTFLVSYVVVSPLLGSLCLHRSLQICSTPKRPSGISPRCFFPISLPRRDPVRPFWPFKSPFSEHLPPSVHSTQHSRVQKVARRPFHIQLAQR